MGSNGKRPGRPVRAGARDDRVAVVLAGGGIIGGVYQVGALKALNDFLVGRTVNDLDIYVGTSCGAFIASCLANRITPEEMMASMAGEKVEGFRFHRSDILRLNLREAAWKLMGVPLELLQFWWTAVRRLRPPALSDVYYRAMKLLPSGLYDSDAIDDVLSRIFAEPRTNDFRKLGRELHVATTDLETSRLRVFSHLDGGDVPISRAVAASTAIPIVYKPVGIQGRAYVDGGINDTMHVDVALARGARLLICINPLVPYVKDGQGAPGHRVLDLGFPFVGKQVVRTILSSRVFYDLRRIRRRHPDVDIILIQPDEKDFKMFYNPIMKYATRVEVAVHGFATAARILARDFEKLREVLARHGIGARLEGLASQLEAIEALGPRSRATGSILEGVARKYRLAPGTRGALAPLAHALHDLDVAIGRTGAPVPRRRAGRRGAARPPKASRRTTAPRGAKVSRGTRGEVSRGTRGEVVSATRPA